MDEIERIWKKEKFEEKNNEHEKELTKWKDWLNFKHKQKGRKSWFASKNIWTLGTIF